MKTNTFSIITFLLFLSVSAFSQPTRDPFLHWSTMSNGLNFKEIKIELVDDSGVLLSNKISTTQGIRIKVLQPTGFEIYEGEVFFGIGVKIVNQTTNEVLVDVSDLYDKEKDGVDKNLLQSLSVKFTPAQEAKAGQVYFVSARFFDKKSDASLTFEMPFLISATTNQTGNAKNFTLWSDLPGYKTIGQAIDPTAGGPSSEVGLFTLNTKTQTAERISKLDFSVEEGLYFQTKPTIFGKSAPVYSYFLSDKNGEVLFESGKTAPQNWDGKVLIQLQACEKGQPILLTLLIEGEKGKVGLSEWIYLRKAPVLSEAEAIGFSGILYKVAQSESKAENGREEYYRLQNATLYAPENASYWYRIGFILIDLDRNQEALEALGKAIRLEPTNIDYIYENAYANKVLGNYALAIKGFQRVMEINEKAAPPRIFLHLGDCYRETGQKTKACGLYQKAAELKIAEAEKRLADNCRN